MISREEVKYRLGREALLMSDVSQNTILDGDSTLNIIEDLFDSFEAELKERDSRTCESCKYSTLTALGAWLECDITDIRELLSAVQETGIKCNKWEKKDD